MAIISGVMQMAGTGEQVEDVGDAKMALSSLFGISETVRQTPLAQFDGGHGLRRRTSRHTTPFKRCVTSINWKKLLSRLLLPSLD